MKNQAFLLFLSGLLFLTYSCSDEEQGGGIIIGHSTSEEVSIGAEAGATYALSFTA